MGWAYAVGGKGRSIFLYSNWEYIAMAARIIDRGRGPELAETRVTVYQIMDFLHEGSSAERIAAELHLTEE
jgi:uncharacterized protein (DUF433 family)